MHLSCDSPFLNRLGIEAIEFEEAAPESSCVPAEGKPLGAFRGLAYAIAFQTGAAALGFAFWEVLHHLL